MFSFFCPKPTSGFIARIGFIETEKKEKTKDLTRACPCVCCLSTFFYCLYKHKKKKQSKQAQTNRMLRRASRSTNTTTAATLRLNNEGPRCALGRAAFFSTDGSIPFHIIKTIGAIEDLKLTHEQGKEVNNESLKLWCEDNAWMYVAITVPSKIACDRLFMPASERGGDGNDKLCTVEQARAEYKRRREWLGMHLVDAVERYTEERAPKTTLKNHVRTMDMDYVRPMNGIWSRYNLTRQNHRDKDERFRERDPFRCGEYWYTKNPVLRYMKKVVERVEGHSDTQRRMLEYIQATDTYEIPLMRARDGKLGSSFVDPDKTTQWGRDIDTYDLLAVQLAYDTSVMANDAVPILSGPFTHWRVVAIPGGLDRDVLFVLAAPNAAATSSTAVATRDTVKEEEAPPDVRTNKKFTSESPSSFSGSILGRYVDYCQQTEEEYNKKK